MLHTEPSFCIYADEEGSLENEKGDLEMKSSEPLDRGEFTFAERSVRVIEEDDKSNRFKNEEMQPPTSPKMYLATMFGINESDDDIDFYKMMVSQDPNNPQALRKYAQLLKVWVGPYHSFMSQTDQQI